MAEHQFGFDLQHSPRVTTAYEVTVECHVRRTRGDNTDVKYSVFRQEDGREIPLADIHALDLQGIALKASRVIPEERP